MDTEIKITAPVLDKSIIQKAAQEAATRAALREIEDYYCGFDSPYRKQLREYLQKNAPSTRLELPEFSEMLSKSLSAEIENIVNKKCVESFAQEIRRAFSHLKEESDGTILLSTLAEDMMTYIDFDDPEYDNSFELEVRDGSFNMKDVYVTISEDDEEKNTNSRSCQIAVMAHIEFWVCLTRMMIMISTQLTRRLRSKPRIVPYHSLCSQV